MPITPGCQPSAASTYAGAPGLLCSASSASASKRIRVSTSRRSALTRSSSVGDRARALRVGGQQQLEPGVGAVQAAGGVEPRRRGGSRSRPRRRRSGRRARRPSARAAPACGCPTSLRRPARTSAAVLAGERDDVGDRGERDEVEVLVGGRRVLAPPPRAARARACRRPRPRTGPGTGSRRAAGARSSRRAARRRRAGVWWSVTTTSMPGRPRRRDLGDRGDRAVDGHQQAGPARGEPLDRRGGEPVAVVDAARQVPVDVGAERPQRAHEDRGRADAVDVVVAVHGDPRARARRGRGSPRRRRARPPKASSGCASSAARKRCAATGSPSPRRTSTCASTCETPSSRPSRSAAAKS